MIYRLSSITNSLLYATVEKRNVRFQASAAKQTRTSPFWVTTQGVVVICRRFERPETSPRITTTRCAVTQNSTALRKTDLFSVAGKFHWLVGWYGCSHTTEPTTTKYFNWFFLITITLASSNNTLPDDGDWTETCRSCFNVSFNILLKQLYCASVGK